MIDPFIATERYACLRLVRALDARGVLGAPGTLLDADDLARDVRALPHLRPLCGALIDVLRRGTVVEMREGRTQVALGRVAAAREISDLPAQRRSLLEREPALAPHLRLLDACTEHLCDVLAGSVPATEILFPGGAMTLVEPVYNANQWADHFNRLVAVAAAEAVSVQLQTDPAAKLRILEVGAGTGGTTATVLAAIAGWGTRLQYHYTDISPGFLAHGRRTLAAAHPFVDFRIFDLEREPAAQGLADADYDLIIATNVVHATRDVCTTTTRLARLLRPQGLLLLNELTRIGAFATLTFGLLDGWWRFTDQGRRAPHGPIVPVANWRHVLRECGFGATEVYGWNNQPETSFQCLFLAERSNQVAVDTFTPPVAPDALPARVTAELARLLALDVWEIAPDTPFAELGVDSIVAPQFVAALNQTLGCTLVPIDIYDYATVHALAGHIGASVAPASDTSAASAVTTTPSASAPSTMAPASSADIAVIGLSCRTPAGDTDGFWDSLLAGQSPITDVPRERWDYRPLYDPDGGPGRITSRWGGFLSDHDKFDPEFFRLSHREAEAMSPQQRVFLEAAWHAIEDAGYAPRDLSGTRCGVFVGVANHDYGGEIVDSRSALGNSNAILTARISYLLDLKGPSLPVDTACSSSLVTIHMACRSILAGECDMALAGGVSVLLTDPRLHRFLSDSGMASPTGRCHAFDAAADGFVPGEGVGVVVLKPLTRAIADRDHIYAVIKGSAINQDGKTSGITAPSGPSQTALECEVYDAAGINPGSIGFVEAHGTGTALGDPIEVNALTTTFRRYTDATGFCALGSVKSNIGHLLTAAGVASFVKAVLALHRETIPPTAHFHTPNPRIDLSNSPFYVNTMPVPWPRRRDARRLAAVSSFGFSGTNAHVVLEEAPPTQTTAVSAGIPHLFLISARNAVQLAARLAALAAWIERYDPPLGDVAFTLAAGRAHFEHRCAIVASTVGELRARLIEAQDDDAGADLIRGHRPAEADPVLDAALSRAVARGGMPNHALLRELGGLYCQGAEGDWQQLFAALPTRRVPLPGYPFERLRFWIDAATTEMPRAVTGPHPLVTASVQPLRYTLKLDGFLIDHRHNGVAVLPAAAGLEAARAAAQAAGLGSVSRLFDITWLRPLRGDIATDAFVALTPRTAAATDFRIVSGHGAAAATHVEGRIDTGRAAQTAPMLDHARRAENLPKHLGHTAIYALFEKLGFLYGPGFRVIEALRTDGTQVLASLSLPAHLQAGHGDYVLHPALLDGAIQSAIGLALGRDGLPPGTVVPVSLGELVVQGRIPAQCIVHVTYAAASKKGGRTGNVQLDIRGATKAGDVVFELRDLTVRISDGDRVRTEDASETLFYAMDWQRTPYVPALAPTGRLLVCARDSAAASAYGANVSVIPGPGFAQHQPGQYEVNPRHEADWRRLWQALEATGLLPDAILHLWNLDAPALDFAARSSAAEVEARFDEQMGSGFWSLVHVAKTMPLRAPARPLDVLYVHRAVAGLQPQHAMIAGFAASVAQEDPAIRIKSLALTGDGPADLVAALRAELAAPGPHAVQLTAQDRLEKRYRAVQPNGNADAVPLRRGGGYVITGGAGGIGSQLARHLARDWGARLVLLGRTPRNAAIRALVTEVEQLGGQATYCQADLCDDVALRHGLDHARGQIGPIHGVIHAAGVGRDGFLRRQPADEIAAVLGPKLTGTLNLDRATADDPLDIFVCFASVAGVLGSVGQSAYAAANAFLDAFAGQRRGPGRTLSIDWSYWRDGGMQNTAPDDSTLFAETGMRWLDTGPALRAFEQAFAASGAQVMVLSGEAGRVDKFLRRGEAGSTSAAPALMVKAAALPHTKEPDAGDESLAEAIRYLTARIAEATGIPAERIQPNRGFEDYGIDSILITKLNAVLEKDFGPLSKTLFFEHADIRSLAGYFLSHQGPRLSEILRIATVEPKPSPAPAPAPGHKDGAEAIAIIGVAGRYPGADDLDTFWRLLAANADMVTEIPPERWDHRRYFDPVKGAPGKTYSKWGGFLREVDRFDPLFFNIAPGDASRMDPQERLFLEVAWETLENAGYTRASLAGPTGRRAVGVYVGVMYGDYQLFSAEEHAKGNPVYGAAPYWSVPNRVSYVLDLHGPSMGVDSACSSSVMAIHLACQSLRTGECHAALAGGVNLSLHPLKYLGLAEGRFASTDGRCRSFRAGGDGYVPGEGVGAVLLKPLADALADGDYIHGVIRATAANHGGKTNGYTVPSPVRQAAVIRDALARAKVDPASIGYIEAHGTGTALGDPIEIAGLSQAFGDQVTHGTCPIGSLKANIGHLEAAAGIAGITKVLLQFQHEQLAPMPGTGADNPNIDFATTPFRLLRRLEPWAPRDGVRRAGVSSFGAGGANGHVVLEAFPNQREAVARDAPVPFVLSARTVAQLAAYRARLHAALTTTAFSLTDIAWTLMVGREAMEERIAFVAASIAEAVAFLAPDHNREGLLRGSVDPDRLLDPPALPGGVAADDLLGILRGWVAGAAVDWSGLGFTGRRVPLPAHPFLGKRYWLPLTKAASDPNVPERSNAPIDRLLPEAAIYTRRFSVGNPLLRDHQVNGRSRLPGVAYIELAQAAAASGSAEHSQIAEIAWVAPFEVQGSGAEVQIALTAAGDDMDFVARTEEGTMLARGRLTRPDTDPAPPPVDIAALRYAAGRRWTADVIYRRFRALGLDYGLGFRRLTMVAVAGDEVIADLDPPGAIAGVDFPPVLLDAALQALIGFQPDDEPGLHLPFALGAVRLYDSLDAARHVHARRTAGAEGVSRFTVSVLDSEGRVLLTLSDLVTRPRPKIAGTTLPLRFLRPMWRREAARPEVSPRQGLSLVISPLPDSPITRTLVASHRRESVREVVVRQAGDGLPHDRLVADYRRVLAECLDTASIYVTAGLDGWNQPGVDDRRPYDLALTLLALFQAIDAGGHAEKGIRVVVLTLALQGVEESPADPAAATLIGLAKTAGQEYPRLEIVLVDVDAAALSDPHLGTRLDAERGARPAIEVAYRGKRRYRGMLTPIAAAADGNDPLPEAAVVLILGGGRGIGLELAVHLARTRRARLALVGRSPPDAALDARLAALRAEGGDGVYFQADGCDETAMTGVVAAIKARWGRIDAAVHSALVLRDVSLGRMDPATLGAAFDPKVRAMLVLRQVLANEKLRLFAVLSSANVFAGAPGQGNYVAASAFADAHAEYLAAACRWPVVTIDWGLWGEVGSVADAAYQSRLAAQGIHPITPVEGLAAFDAVLRSGLQRVAVVKVATETLAAQGIAVEARPAIRLPGPDQSNLLQAASSLNRPGEVPALQPTETAFAAVEAYGRRALRAAFGRTAALPAGRAFTFEGLCRRFAVAPRHRKLFHALLEMLAADGSVALTDGLWRPIGDQAAADATMHAARANAEAARADNPWVAAPLDLLDNCIAAYPDVLRGERDPLELLFPGGSPAQLERIYDGSPIVDHFNKRLAETVAAFIEARLRARSIEADPTSDVNRPLKQTGLEDDSVDLRLSLSEVRGLRPIRILEVGAGTGGSSAAILAALAPFADAIEYVYSDVSQRFLRHGENRFANHFRFLRFASYDLERDAEANGVTPGAFDAVIGTNVLHATACLTDTLRRLKRILARHGALFINEVTRRQDFATLVFGLTDGWWRTSDPEDRLTQAPLADAEQWARLLLETGYQGIRVHALPALTNRMSPQSLILAESDGWVDAGDAATAAPSLPKPATMGQPTAAWGEPTPLIEQTIDYLSDVFVDVLKLDPTDLRRDSHFDRYGMESLSALAIRDRLANDIPGLPATLLFEHNTLARLAGYLAEQHRVPLEALLGRAPTSVTPLTAKEDPARPEMRLAPASPSVRDMGDMPIAIIGVSGRYPGAPTLDAFWRLLVEGGSAISEVPPDRWNAEAYLDPSGKAEDRSYTKWGGFIADVDKFDPRFFGIAPLEAESMDPQERLFLETAWAVLEDAGYTPARLRDNCRGGEAGSDVGVFVGVMNAAYQWLAAEGWQAGNVAAGASAYWSIANRVSYLFDFSGPSLAVDTACSSSLTAIHLACESLRRGECRAAVAGGVNLILHPRQFVNLSRARMVSRGAECRAFGAGADGFVDGEGVGAVLLKPLRDAERDGDRIDGVILGSAVNAGGRTSGFTVPNPAAQARVMQNALARAGVDPASIGYVEAHGTGTALGDPIEIAGLRLVFGEGNPGPCAIGSVKANIGHLESAAGIAGLTKLVLQLRHGTVAPSPYATRPNPLIDFAASPVLLPAYATAWEPRPAPHGYWPRRAGVSSFGAGGANAHLIVEQHLPPSRPLSAATSGPDIVLLSARTAERLQAVIRDLLDFLPNDAPDDPAAYLADFAHTLRLGRESMSHRIAVLADSLDAVRAKLGDFLAGRDGIEDLFHGEAKAPGREPVRIESWQVGTDERRRLALVWVKGIEVDWNTLPAIGPRRILSLPTYPFRRERYWIERPEPAEDPGENDRASEPDAPETCVLLARSWREVSAEAAHRRDAGTLVVCTDDRDLYEQVAVEQSRPTLWVRRGSLFRMIDDLRFEVDLDRNESLARLFRRLRAAFPAPYRVINLWRRGSVERACSAEDALLASVHLVKAARAESIERLTLIHAIPADAGADSPLDHAAAGFARVAQAEHPGHRVATVGAEASVLVGCCLAEADNAAGDAEVRYQNGRRLVPVVERLSVPIHTKATTAFREGGVYLLAGGLGEVGFALARELLSRYRARVVVLGRRRLEGELRYRAEQLGALRGTFVYMRCDVADRAALDAVLADTRQRFGAIHGVLHLARAVDPGPIDTVPVATFRDTLTAKVAGSINLDAALADEPLDWFVMFSSLAAWQGLAGAAGYATACAFQDGFATDRAQRVARGIRSGRSVSICWPQWTYDRYLDADKMDHIHHLGLHTIDASTGLLAIERALASNLSSVGVLAGDDRAIEQLLINPAPRPAAADDMVPDPDSASLDAMSDDELAAYLAYLRTTLAPSPSSPPQHNERASLESDVIDSFASYLKIPASEITRDTDFAELGLDSIKALHIAERLQRRLGIDIAPALFLEHTTAAALAHALQEHHGHLAGGVA